MNYENPELAQLLTLKQAAARLAVSSRTLERKIQHGEFPPLLKIGSAARVELAAVLRYIESLRRPRSPQS